MANKAIVEARVNEVANLIMQGWKGTDIMRLSSEKYAISARNVQKYIQKAQPFIRDKTQQHTAIINKAHEAVISQVAENDLLTAIEKRKILKAIATGEIQITKIVGYEMIPVVSTELGPDGPVEVVKQVPQIITAETIPNLSERLKAIALDNNMSGDNAAQKVELHKGKRQVFKIGNIEIEL